MGIIKERLIEVEESRLANLSEALGISWEELAELDYEIFPNQSDEGLLYEYLITFSADNNPKILAKIDSISETNTISLSPWIFERGYDEEYELGAITQNIDHKASFLREIEASQQLQDLAIQNHATRKLLLRQIFVTIIGALETFLSDQFISKTLAKERHLRNFVMNHPEFKKQKFSVSEIYDVSSTIKERAKTIMVGTIYHKLPVVKEMYTQTFEVNFPDISSIQKYILIRHDLVHRNGKTVEGKLVQIDDELVNELREAVLMFVKELVGYLNYDDLPF